MIDSNLPTTMSNNSGDLNTECITIAALNEYSQNMNTNFFVLHQNIQSFHSHFLEFEAYLEQLSEAPDAIALSETWFKPENIADIAGYHSFHSIREHKNGGGISLFIKENLICEELNLISRNDEFLEICAIKVNISSSCRIAIIAVYRPPNASVQEFNVRMNELLGNLRSYDHILLIGDINIDIGNPTNVANDFINICLSHSFISLINSPTRVTNTCASVLDHIWSNNLYPPSEIFSGILTSEITDHYTTFMKMKISWNKTERVLKSFRDHSERSLNNLKFEIENFVFNFSSDNYHDLHHKVQSFSDHMYDIYNRCCPIRTKCISENRQRKPWISHNLIDMINTKHQLNKMKQQGMVTNMQYNQFKNQTTTALRNAKRQYYHDMFNNASGNIKKTWKCINSLIKSRKPRNSIFLKQNDAIIDDSKAVAEIFSNFFSNIASDLDKKIPSTDKSPLEYLNNSVNSSFFAYPTNINEVINIIKSFPNKTVGLASIPVFIYKIISNVISPLIAQLFNESLVNGIFPDCLKVAKIIPIHKSGDKKEVKNYRPISMLPFLSKIFERLMHKRLNSYLKKAKVLCNNQFGFRENSNTSDAVLEALDNIYTSLENWESVATVFLDFSKAFDTVNHRILIQKLEHLGIRGRANDWFSSYLTNRQQTVCIDKISSTPKTITMGVPQGSILSPTIFLLYINDMAKSSDALKFIHFADDTTVFASHKNLNSVTDAINNGLENIDEWLKANRLSLNVEKTSYMLFSNKKSTDCPIFKIRNQILSNVSNAKFLGIHLDDKLSFKNHVDTLCKKLSQSLGAFRKIAFYLPEFIKTKLYYSLIYSRLSYGILAWGRSGKVNNKKIQALQDRALKILNLEYTNHSFLDFNSIYEYSSQTKLHNILNRNHHSYFRDKLSNLTPSHNHHTRGVLEGNFEIPSHRTSKIESSFLYNSIKIWNKTPAGFKSIKSLNSYKKAFKQFLLNKRVITNN